MTRKGLAFGAAASLGVSLFTAMPANAAGLLVNGYVSLLPTSGTVYATLSSEAFDLKSNVVGSLAGTTDKNLKFLIEDSDELIAIDVDVDAQATASEAAGVTITAMTKVGSIATLTGTSHGLEVGDAINVTTAADDGLDLGVYTVLTVADANTFTVDSGDTDAADVSSQVPVYKTGDADDIDSRELIAGVGEADADTHFATATIPAVSGETDGRKADGSFVVDTETNANSVDRILRLVNTDATKTTTVTVTAWVDDNDDNDIDPTEYVSAARAITFYKTSDLSVVTTLTTPVIGDAAINGTIAITPALNGDQIRTTATAGVYVVPTVQAGTASVTSVTWNTTTKVWDIVIGDSNNVEVGTFTAKAEIADAATGNTSSVLVSTATAADTNMTLVAGADQTAQVNKTASSAGSATVRAKKSATVVVTAYDADQDTAGTAVVANKTVNVVLTGATTTTDWTINGTKVLDNAASATKQYTTDANGQLTLVVSSTSGAASDTITIEARPEGLTGAAAAKIALTWATAVYDIEDLNAPANGTARNVVKGGNVTFDLVAADQFGQLMTGDYRLQMTKSGRSDGTDTVSFSSGRVTYTVSDTALGSGSTITVATQLQELTAGVWGNSTDASDLPDVTVTTIAAPTTSVVPSVTYSSGSTFDLVTKQIVATDSELGTAAQVTLESNTASLALSAGTGLAAGDVVTVSGAGLWFSYYDASATAILSTEKDSLTFVIDNASDTVRVHSNTYVKNAVVTLTANGRSGTAKVTSDVAGPDSGTTVNWNVPTSTKPGTTFTVAGTLVDAFGNPVNATSGDVSLTYTGPGFVSGSLPTDTNAKGGFSFSVLLGSADTGAITVTFSYDTNADGDLLDTGEFANSVTINGAAPAADTKVNAGSFKGYVAVYAKGYEGKRLSAKIGNDWIIVPALASNFVRVTDFTGAGVSIAVRIYIDRVLIDTINLVTK